MCRGCGTSKVSQPTSGAGGRGYDSSHAGAPGQSGGGVPSGTRRRRPWWRIAGFGGMRRRMASWRRLRGGLRRSWNGAGVGPGERVVLWGENSAEWIGVFFGCLLRGVVVAPLDAAGEAGFAARVVAGCRGEAGGGGWGAAGGARAFSVVGSPWSARTGRGGCPIHDGGVMPGLKSRRAGMWTKAGMRPISETRAGMRPISETKAGMRPISETTTQGNPSFRDEAQGRDTYAVAGVDGVGGSD